MKRVKRFLKYFLAMLLPLAVLLVRPLTPAMVLMFGQEIRLATAPVDPRDVFRGDYVTLSFEIERLDDRLVDLEVTESIRAYEDGYIFPRRFAYVTLEPASDDKNVAWRPARVSLVPPESGVYLRAAPNYYSDTWDYGDYLRRYYVKENTGLELERAAQNGNITAVAKAWRGRAVLTSLEIEEP